MKKSIKAVLLSSLVFPGTGHLFLKKYRVAFLYIGLFSLFLVMLVSQLLAKANQLFEQIERGEIPADIQSISNSLLDSSSNQLSLNVSIYVLMLIWLIAAWDAYRLGQKS